MKPTLRDNYRYIVVKIISDNPITKEDIELILQRDIISIVGQLNYSGIMPKIVFFDRFRQSAIIRCLHTGTDILKSGLAMAVSHNSKKIHIMPVFTSGTIRKAKEIMSKRIV